VPSNENDYILWNTFTLLKYIYVLKLLVLYQKFDIFFSIKIYIQNNLSYFLAIFLEFTIYILFRMQVV